MAERKKRVVPEKFEGRKIYSISRLLSFNNCKHGYHLNYNLRKKGTPNIYSAMGTKVHDMLELMQFGKLTNEDAVMQFRGALFENIDIMGYKFASEKIQTNFVNSVEHCLRSYKPIPCKNFKSELEFFTEIGGAVLVGYIDAVVLNEDNTLEVIDYKTSSKYTKANLDEHGMQLIVYALAIEQEFGAKISKVKWNMLKYCNVDWRGVSVDKHGFYLRSELVMKLRNELKRMLRKSGMTEEEIIMNLDIAEAKNDLSVLPEEIVKNFHISEGYVEYEITEENRKSLVKFISDTVTDIESRNPSDESHWIATPVSKDNSFFCGTLCDHKANCSAYKEYLKSLEGVNLDTITEKNSDAEMLKNLFG
jgi:ATP-dependent helicase/DNAse subunit B